VEQEGRKAEQPAETEDHENAVNDALFLPLDEVERQPGDNGRRNDDKGVA
jgi:hypothetical protein